MGKEIDIRSLACVLSGDKEGQFIDLIVELRGLPLMALVPQRVRAHYYFDEGGGLPQNADVQSSVVAVSRIKIRDAVFLDLGPAVRLTADQLHQGNMRNMGDKREFFEYERRKGDGSGAYA
jgi:hypothetical protein